MMMFRKVFTAVYLLIALILIPETLSAAEQYEEFLQGLQDEGLGDLSIEYMNKIKTRTNLPDELKTTWDLEMANSLRVASLETKNTDLKQKYLLDAQTSLEKFLKENPTHEEAPKAYSTSGQISLIRAETQLLMSMREKDKAKRDALVLEVRKLITEARDRFVKSADQYKLQVDALEQGKANVKSQRAQRRAAELVNTWRMARHQISVCDFNLGMTYPDVKDPKRKEILTKAAKGFDSIYQETRAVPNQIGLLNHMWEGRTQEELGDYLTALDIYDEVMSAQPKQNDSRMAEWTKMFHTVNRFRLMLYGRTQNYEKLVVDAELWLAQNQRQKTTIGYQGIMLELAKAHLQLAKDPKYKDAAQSTKEAKRLLALIIQSPIASEFKNEAILVSRTAGGGDAGEIASFDEAIAIGDAAVKAANESANPADAKNNWTEARKAYERALQLTAGVKDPNRPLAARFTLAFILLTLGEPGPSYDMALALAKEPNYAKAPAAGALAVNAALALYGQTKDPAALAKINESTDLVTTQFAKYAEADDARIAKGKLKLIQGDAKGAVEIFKSVNAASDRYPGALQLAAATYWQMYNEAKRKQGDKEAPALRKLAVETIDQSLAAFQKGGSTIQATQLQDAKLLKVETYLEENKPADASPVLEPMFEAVKAKQPVPKDKGTLRILVYSLKVFAANGNQAKAIEAGQLLLSSGDDIPVVNSSLIEFAGILAAEWKKTANQLIAAEESKDEGSINNAKVAETAARETAVKVLDQLRTRQQHDLAGLVFLAEKNSELGMNDKAREQFQAITDRAASDQAFGKAAAKYLIRIRTQLIAILRTEEKYEEALPQIEAVLKEQPNSLEPMMEKGRILQKLGEKDAKRNEQAIQWWTDIRLKLSKTAGKKPKEYYEAIYNCAECLETQGKPESLENASKLLRSTLAVSPDLDGPDRVSMYQTLLKKLPAPTAKPAAPAATKAGTKPAAKTKK